VTDNAGLGTLTLSSLQTVGGALSVTDNAGLGTLTLSSLQTVGGALSINTNARLLVVDMSVLREVGAPELPSDDFNFNSNATALAAGILQVVMPSGAQVRLHGTGSILNNRRTTDGDLTTQIRDRINNQGFAPLVVANNSQ